MFVLKVLRFFLNQYQLFIIKIRKMILLKYSLPFCLIFILGCSCNNNKSKLTKDDSLKKSWERNVTPEEAIRLIDSSTKNDSIYKISKQNINIKPTDYLLTQWLKRNVGCKYINIDIQKAKFVDSFYKGQSNLPFDKDFPTILSIEEDSIRNFIPSIEYSFKQISFSIRGEISSYSFYILEDKFIFSKHYMSSGESTIFDFRTNKVKDLDFEIANLKDGQAEILSRGRDGKTLRMVSQEGTYNINTGKIKWIKN